MDIPDFGIPPALAARMTMAERHEYLRAKLSRRRALVTAGAVAAGLLAGGCSDGAGARSAAGSPLSTRDRVSGSVLTPFGRHLAFGADPRTAMRISWQVPLAVRRPHVRVGLRPDALDQRVPAEVRPLRTPELAGVRPAAEQFHLHAALDGLRPGTTYYYGVGHDGLDPAASGRRADVASFRTAPATGPDRFVFTAFGDQGVGEEAAANDRLLLGQDPAFHLHAGDICYANDSGKGRESDLFDASQWDRYLRQTEPVARSVPWMVTTGNHDMEAWYSPDGYGGQLARFSLPDSGFDPRGTPGAYTFRYGNVGVVALDANDVSYELPANRGNSGGRQTAWLARTLRELRSAPGVDFVVVFFHHCAYSTSTHASDGGVRAAWLPLFARYRVDLVINGHNHVYERTDAIREGGAVTPVPVGGWYDPERHGTVYVTAGGGGRELYGFPGGVKESYEGGVAAHEPVRTFHWTASRETRPETVMWSRVRYRGFSLLRVEARAGAAPRLAVSALTPDGGRVDHFEVRRGG